MLYISYILLIVNLFVLILWRILYLFKMQWNFLNNEKLQSKKQKKLLDILSAYGSKNLLLNLL